MAIYLLQRLIAAAELATAPDPEELTDTVESRVREMLIGAWNEDDPTVAVEWLALIPGDRDAGTVVRFLAWRPGAAVPPGARELICRGSREL